MELLSLLYSSGPQPFSFVTRTGLNKCCIRLFADWQAFAQGSGGDVVFIWVGVGGIAGLAGVYDQKMTQLVAVW